MATLVFTPGLGRPPRPDDSSKLSPVDLKGKDKKLVAKWIDDIEVAVSRNNEMYHVSAFIYLVNEYYPCFKKGVEGINPEYTEVVGIIESIMGKDTI